MVTRWRQKAKGAGKCSGRSGCGEQSPGFKPEPASQGCAHKHVCTRTRVPGNMWSVWNVLPSASSLSFIQ